MTFYKALSLSNGDLEVSLATWLALVAATCVVAGQQAAINQNTRKHLTDVAMESAARDDRTFRSCVHVQLDDNALYTATTTIY